MNTHKKNPKKKTTLEIKLLTQQFIDKKLKIILNGFIFNFSKKNYIITLHHNLPIDNVSSTIDNVSNTIDNVSSTIDSVSNTIDNVSSTIDSVSLDIQINSCWSEVLILNTDKLDLSSYKINKKYQNSLPKINETLNLIQNINRYNLTVINYEFLPFDNLQSDYLIPYIIVTFENDLINDYNGLSGVPIYINDKLIGIFSKYNIINKTGYILPIYIVIKNFYKNNNADIYTIKNLDKLTKINNYKIKNSSIYSSLFKINIPLCSYILIENDKIFNNYRDCYINTTLQISNECNIIINNDLYKLTSRILNLANKIDKNITLQLLKIITNNYTDELWFHCNNNIIIIK